MTSPTIHLMHGFMGFGKTTLAKRLEQELPAVRFTHDVLMLERYGCDPEDFAQKYKIVDDFIKAETVKEIKKGNNVILDYGFWEKQTRTDYYNWAKALTPNVVFHAIRCDLSTAKSRVLKRTQVNEKELFIDEFIFNDLLKRFEPFDETEGYPVIFYDVK